jgi:hypothetical protein
MFNQNDDDRDYGEPIKKRSIFPKILKWTIYLVCILVLAIVIYRVISTGLPKELDNYIIKSPKIEESYKNLKDDFKIYQIIVRGTFAMGDALFIEKAYYLENAENLQITLRCKNLLLAQLILSELGIVGDQTRSNNPTVPLKTYLKLSEIADIDKADKTEETAEDNIVSDYIVLETVSATAFGKSDDRYKYFVLSFDGVKIDYENSKVEFYVFYDNNRGEVVFDEDESIARFTIFDVNMSKTKLQAKKFKLDKLD